MPKVTVTFDHPTLRGSLEFDAQSQTLAAVKQNLARGSLGAQVSANRYFEMELSSQIAESAQVSQFSHGIPTEEGLYLDCDGDIWRVDELNELKCTTQDGMTAEDAENYTPFTQLKLGRMI